MSLETIDFIIVAAYALMLVTVAQWVSREKPGHKKDAQDYFLASKSLPWWAVGASLIAANISAEQIIGMSGSGFAIGLAIASYEWMAAITLVIVGKFFLPIFLKSGIYTMPQFLEQRYDHRVRNVMAVFWLGVYVLVNLTSVLWLGSLTINALTGLDLFWGLILLGGFASLYSLYGGMKAIALTDIIQVVLLVFGGLAISYITLDSISEGQGAARGFITLMAAVPEKFHMILQRDNPQYMNLPGISVLVGGMWVMNISYWGFNQYIIQRALAAKDLREAQKGILFASFLKLLMPLLIVVPGIAAVVLAPEIAAAPDRAYPEMMKLAPAGLRGLIFAALVAAIVSSVGSMMNSIGTIFTMDLYRHYAPKDHAGRRVRIGRIAALAGLVIAIVAARPLLGNFDQAFQYIQEFTGFFTPGIVAIFLLGMFWQRMTAHGALAAAIASAALSLLFRLWWSGLPFIDRVGLVFLLSCGIGAAVSLLAGQAVVEDTTRKPVDLNGVEFKTTMGYNLGGAVVTTILIVLYWVFW